MALSQALVADGVRPVLRRKIKSNIARRWGGGHDRDVGRAARVGADFSTIRGEACWHLSPAAGQPKWLTQHWEARGVLRLIRPSGPANNPEMVALRAECEGLQLALSLAQEALREERSDEEHWRDEAKHLRELLAAPKREPEINRACPRRRRLPSPTPSKHPRSRPLPRIARALKWRRQNWKRQARAFDGGRRLFA